MEPTELQVLGEAAPSQISGQVLRWEVHQDADG